MKKVLYLTTVSGTINAFLVPHIEMLLDEGYVVDVASCIDRPIDEKLINRGIKVFNIPFSRKPLYPGNIKAFLKLIKIQKQEQYDIVHVHTPVAGLFGRLLKLFYPKLKTIYTAHGFHFFKGAPLLNWLVYFPIEYICSFFTDILITINQEDYYLAKKVMEARKIKYISGVGIDINKYQNIQVDKKVKRKELGIPENAIMLLSVGELSPRKNHQVVLRALEKLKDANIHYCIAGQGNLEEKLKIIVNDLEIQNQVHFLGYRKDINELCKVADIFVFPSLQEGLPVALMEAMASGLPVVCSDIRGNNDLINEDGGYRCDPKSVDDFFNGINELIKNEDKKVYYQNNNLETIREFSIDLVKSKMVKIYN